MDSKKYFLIIALPIGILAISLISLSFYLQPFAGDLTRIGGYTENDFGWNESQYGYLDIGTNYVGVEPEPVDIDYAIYGDSFSHWCLPQAKLKSGHELNKGENSSCFQWTSFFKNETSLEGLTFHQDHYSVAAFVEQVQKQSIQFVVFQSVERYAVPRLINIAEQFGCVSSPNIQVPIVAIESQSKQKIEIKRSSAINGFNMNEPAAYLKQLMISVKKPRVLKDALLPSPQLFSNVRKQELIYHYEDRKKLSYTAEHYATAQCGMKAFAAKIYKELGVPSIFLIAPDKSSIYAKWFQNQERSVESIIPKLMDRGVNLVDLYSPMLRAAKNGAIDLYLPNDTHWGARGGEIAARELIQFITVNEE